MSHDDIKVLAEHWKYQGFISIKQYLLKHKLFAGGWSEEIFREVSIRPPAAAALLYDPILDKVVLIEQFRVGALDDEESPWLIEAVAGLMEKGETPEELVIRETQEEAGLEVLDIIPICHYWSTPGGSNERVFLFCVRVDASQAGGIFGLVDEHEDIRVRVIDAQEAFNLVATNKIRNGISLVSLLWFQLHREEVRSKWLAK